MENKIIVGVKLYEVISECGEVLGRTRDKKEAQAFRRELKRVNKEYGWDEVITIEEAVYQLDSYVDNVYK